MIWLKILGGVAGAVVAYLLIAGSVVAKGHVVTVSATFAKPPEEIWQLITDHVGQTAWRKDLKGLKLLPARDDQRVAFEEESDWGKVQYVVEESVAGSAAPSRHVVRILNEDLGYGGKWIFELAPAGAGSRLAITEDGEVTSFMFRALSPFFSKTASIEKYLAALGAKLGVQPVPTHAEAARDR